MRLKHGGVVGAEFGTGLVERSAGSEPAEELGHAMFAAGDHGRGEMMRAGDDVGDDLGGDGVRHGGFEDADDGGGARSGEAVEAQGLADHRWVGVEGLGPELIGEDDGAGGVGAIVGGAEQSAEDGAQAHDFEVVAIDDASGNGARLAEALHGEVDFGKRAELGDGFEVLAQVVDFGNGEGGVYGMQAGCALANVEEAGFVAIGEGAQQHGADDGEDGGVGADAEGEREGHGDPEGGDAGEGANSDSEITKERHGVSPSEVTAGPGELRVFPGVGPAMR